MLELQVLLVQELLVAVQDHPVRLVLLEILVQLVLLVQVQLLVVLLLQHGLTNVAWQVLLVHLVLLVQVQLLVLLVQAIPVALVDQEVQPQQQMLIL
jgi:hypothetical protein